LTGVYILSSAAVFAALSASTQDLFAFPALVTLWFTYVCVLVPAAVGSLSTPPHPPRRVTIITIAAAVVAIGALALSLYIGLWMFAENVR
jgi:uncharacterized membrane protein